MFLFQQHLILQNSCSFPQFPYSRCYTDLFFLIRYEQQLSASLEREKNLEIMRTQIELEWQKCCANMKTEHNHMNQQLIKGLSQNKNQVSVQCVCICVYSNVLYLMMKVKLIKLFKVVVEDNKSVNVRLPVRPKKR